MRNRSLTAVLAGLAATAMVLLGACADEPADLDPPPGSPPATPVPPDPPTLPSPVPPVTPPPELPPTDPDGQTTITGQVVAGVELGCVLLETEFGQFLVYGAAADELEMGTTATVRGVAEPGLPTTCQQGVPFEVHEVID